MVKRTADPGTKRQPAHARGSVLVAAVLLACGTAHAQAPSGRSPFPGAAMSAAAPSADEPLLDCSLHRYGDRLDEAVAGTLKRFADRRASTALQAALASGARTDVTDFLYRERLVRHVEGCAQPVVRGFVKGTEVQIQLIAVQRDTCLQLLASPRLQAAGIEVLALHDPSGEARCGTPRNPIPGLLTWPFDARRMLPGDNTVTMVANYAVNCPSVDRHPDPVIEDIVKTQLRDTTDFPRRWVSPACMDLLGGPSSMGVCTTAEWDRYHDRLSVEFERILADAVRSADPVRVYSAAWWLIDKSDPDKFTIRGYDYRGRECDMLRNRIVAAWGLCTSKKFETEFWSALHAFSGTGAEFKRLWENTLEGALPCLQQIPAEYDNANDLIDAFMRPMPFTAKRLEILERVQGAVQAAMQKLGHGNCPYYGEAVVRQDYVRWKSQYRGGLTSSPPDWEHDFWEGAAKCAAGR